MSTSAISSYLTSYSAATSNSVKDTDSNGNSLSMSDFITLLVAQLQNQDMNNTTDMSEMVSQMAQYSMIEAINEMNDQSKLSSSFNLIGKGVTISTDDGYAYGKVDGVTITDGAAKVVIKGKSYSVDDIKEVFDASLLDSTTE